MAPATSYAFQVRIPKDADISSLRSGGYQLGVMKKSSASSATPVQWLSLEIVGATLTVGWYETYFLYYTSQDLSKDGVKILRESNDLPAQIGKKYSYKGVFTGIGSASRPDGIEVENDLRAGSDHYGIWQKVFKNGRLVQAPFIASSIPYKGTSSFSLAHEEVEVYFTNAKQYTRSDGVVAKFLSNSRTATTSIVLKPGVTSAVAYDVTKGEWTPVAPLRSALAAAPSPLAEINTRVAALGDPQKVTIKTVGMEIERMDANPAALNPEGGRQEGSVLKSEPDSEPSAPT